LLVGRRTHRQTVPMVTYLDMDFDRPKVEQEYPEQYLPFDQA
jgi:hypothetical protein